MLCERPTEEDEITRYRPGKRYLQTTYPVKDLYLDYIRNSQNTIVKTIQIIQLESRQKTHTDISLKSANKHMKKCSVIN